MKEKNHKEWNRICTGWRLLHTGFKITGGRASYWKIWTYAQRVFERE